MDTGARRPSYDSTIPRFNDLTNTMRFAQPHFLWLLLVFPPGLALFYWWSWRQRQALMQRFIQARLLPNLTIGLSPARQKVRLGCLVAGVVLLILALARPQWGYAWEEVKRRGLDIVVAIDTSKSMLARDIAPSRLARAKLATLDLLRLAKTDRLGLVAFAGTAFLQCPLTIDETSFRQSLEALDVNIIPQGGTALAQAIDMALTAFKEDNNFKVLVILTDGEDHDGDALEAAERAAKAGLRIFTIGIGTAEGELLQIQDDQGRTDYVRDEQGNVVKSKLNGTLLQQIAGATEGGFYLPLRGAKPMEMLYERGLAPLPKSEGKEKLVRQYHERFHWPLALALVLFAFEAVWPETKRPPRRAGVGTPVAPRGAAGVAAALAFALAVGANASPSSALRDYEAGRYEESLKGYEELAQRRSEDPRLRFNAGAAAYRNGQFDEAAKWFGQVTTAPDLRLQEHAYYNLGNALFRAGEVSGDPKQTQANWEKALQQYDRALKLNTNNADARFNQEFVKRRLEELKQQPPPQSQPDRSKDQEDPKDQPQDQQAKQDQQPQNQERRQDEQQQQQAQEQRQQDQRPQSQPQPKEQDEQQQQAQGNPDQPKEEEQTSEQKGERQPASPGQMTPEEAKRLLDAQKGEEQVLQFRPPAKPRDARRPFKDW